MLKIWRPKHAPIFTPIARIFSKGVLKGQNGRWKLPIFRLEMVFHSLGFIGQTFVCLNNGVQTKFWLEIGIEPPAAPSGL